jgi:hypothetical protein
MNHFSAKWKRKKFPFMFFFLLMVISHLCLSCVRSFVRH